MRLPVKYPLYPFNDNEYEYFGTDLDIKVYFDGTYYRFDGSNAEILFKLTTAAVAAIYGGVTTGDDLTLYGSTADAKSYINIQGNQNIKIVCGGQANNITLSGGADYAYFDENNGTVDCRLTTTSNRNIFLNPNGTGKVKFGTKTTHGDQAIDGYVTILDSSGNTVNLATLTPT